MANAKIISRKQLSGEDEFSFCPYCLKEFKSEGKDPKEYLQPLFLVLTATYQEAFKRDLIQSHYECPRCKKTDITVDTFMQIYCK